MTSRKGNAASRLRHRLTLQQEIRTPDGAGGYVKTWSNVVDLWAEIAPLAGSSSKLNISSGKEILLGEQIQAEISHRILLRYRGGVTPAMRLLYGSRIFNIRYAANTDERGHTLEILAQEGVAT